MATACLWCLQVGRIKQKRGYKDQWPYNIKIYTDDQGNNKGDAALVYEDPSAAHSAGGFYNSTPLFSTIFQSMLLHFMGMSNYFLFSSDYDMRGYKIGVGMAEKSAPRAPPAYGQGYMC